MNLLNKKIRKNQQSNNNKGFSKLVMALYSILIMIIFIVVLYNIDSHNTITIISDEFGYWYAGATFAGVDWREVAYLNPYYGFGYGLLLCPLFWIFRDAASMYQAAIVYNAIFMVLSFILGVKVLDRLTDIRKEWKLLISFASVMYSNLIYQSQTTQVECLLNLLFWWEFYCFINIVQQKRYRDYIFMVLGMVYMYAVHMRSIGVLIAGTTLVVLISCTQKGLWKKTFLYIMLLLIGVICAEGVKGELKEYTYAPLSEYVVETESDQMISEKNKMSTETQIISVSHMAHTNDYSAIMGNIDGLFTWEGIQKLVAHVIGKLYYLLGASLFLVGYACIDLLKKLWEGGLAIYKKQECTDSFWISSFLTLCFLAAIGIASIFLLDYSRQDMVVYGRYVEYILGPLLCIGLYVLLEKRITMKTFWICCIVEFGFAAIVRNVMVSNGFNQYLDNNAVGLVSKIISVYGELGNEKFAIAILTFVFLQALFVWLCANMKQSWGAMIAIGICVIVWVYGGNAVYEHNTVRHHERLQNTINLAQILNDNAANDVIYYVHEPGGYITIDYVQFQLLNHPIKVINTADIQDNIQPGYYLVGRSSNVFYNYDENFLERCNNFKLYYFE